MRRRVCLALLAASAAACTAVPPPRQVAAEPLPAGVTSATATPRPRLAPPRETGKLVVLVRMDEHPRAVNKDPAYACKRAFEVALAGEVARRVLGDPGKAELRGLVRRVDHIDQLTAGQAHLAVSGIPVTLWNESLGVAFSEPYATTGLALLTLGEAAYPDLESLRGKRVAVVTSEEGRFLGAELEALAERHEVPLRVSLHNTFEQAVAALHTGRADALLTLSVTGRVLMEQSQGAALRLQTGLFPAEPVAVAVRQGDAELLAAVNDTLRELQATGRLEELAREAGFPLDNVVRLQR